MENSSIVTTTTGGPNQLPISLTNQQLAGQNLTESSTIGIYEISKLNLGGTATVATQTTGQLLISIPIGKNEEQHPTSGAAFLKPWKQLMMAYPSIVRATRGRQAQLYASLSQRPIYDIYTNIPLMHPTPLADDDQIAVAICQNQPESGTIPPDISKLNSGGTTTVASQTAGQLQLIIPIGDDEEEHPTSRSLALMISPEAVALLLNSSDISTTHQPAPVAENEQHHSTTIENVVPDIENQPESTTTSMLNPENIDSSNNPPIATRIATTPHTALLHNYSNPKIATYFVGVYPAFLACVAFFTGAKNSPFVTHKSLMRSSLVAYFMAILVLRILFCLYDHLRRPSNQHFYLRLYKVLAYVYDILWMLAILLVVPALPQH